MANDMVAASNRAVSAARSLELAPLCDRLERAGKAARGMTNLIPQWMWRDEPERCKQFTRIHDELLEVRAALSKVQGRLVHACGVMCSVGCAIESGARAMAQSGDVEAAEERVASQRLAHGLPVYGKYGN